MAKLDYTLTTSEERIEAISKLDLSSCNSKQLEFYADYILHPCRKETHTITGHSKEESNISLEQLAPLENPSPPKPRKGHNHYIVSIEPIDWENPALISLKQDIDTLKQAAAHTTGSRSWQLKRWARELSMEARLRIPGPGTRSLPQDWSHAPSPDLEAAGLDWTDSFHIKHLVKHYSALREGNESKWTAFELERLVDATPMEDWERHIFIRHIDGTNAIIVARELAYSYDKFIRPGYLSQVMRRLYRAIAQTAEKDIYLWQARRGVVRTKKCPTCQRYWPDHELWWRQGQRRCKPCLLAKEREKRKPVLDKEKPVPGWLDDLLLNSDENTKEM